MDIRVTPEGRDGVWIPESDDVISFIWSLEFDSIHNYNPNPRSSILIGADWSKESVVEKVENAERLAVLTGEAKEGNMNHALAVIQNNELSIFDIGDVTEHLRLEPTPG